MAAAASFRWIAHPSVLADALGDYGKRLIAAVFALAQLFAAKIEAFAKVNAPWTDRTGHARQSLTGIAVKAATGVVIYLVGLAHYQIWLELKNQGRYAVILRAMEAHYSDLMSAIRRLVGAR